MAARGLEVPPRHIFDIRRAMPLCMAILAFRTQHWGWLGCLSSVWFLFGSAVLKSLSFFLFLGGRGAHTVFLFQAPPALEPESDPEQLKKYLKKRGKGIRGNSRLDLLKNPGGYVALRVV